MRLIWKLQNSLQPKETQKAKKNRSLMNWSRSTKDSRAASMSIRSYSRWPLNFIDILDRWVKVLLIQRFFIQNNISSLIYSLFDKYKKVILILLWKHYKHIIYQIKTNIQLSFVFILTIFKQFYILILLSF